MPDEYAYTRDPAFSYDAVYPVEFTRPATDSYHKHDDGSLHGANYTVTFHNEPPDAITYEFECVACGFKRSGYWFPDL